MHPPIRFPELHDPDWLREQYIEKRNAIALIASRLGCTPDIVYKRLKHYGIPLLATERLFKPKRCYSCYERYTPTSANSRYCSPECKSAGPADTAPPLVDLAASLRRETR